MYSLTLHQEPDYLHAIVTGTNSEQSVRGYLEQIRRECIARNCPRVLIEERLEGPRLGTLPIFQIVSDGAEQARGMLRAIAYVDRNAKGNSMQFAEIAAVNRGLPVAVFSSVSEAKTWLTTK